MTASRFSRFATSLFAASALLAGCGGNANVAPSAPASGAAIAGLGGPLVGTIVRPRGERFISNVQSWMAPNAGKQQLLYVSDATTNEVDVYSYPSDALVGALAGFNVPQSECVDVSGNVFIADGANSRLREYAHGSITAKATLQDPGYVPVSCSLDPTTGNLAVGNFDGTGSQPGNVALYKGAAGAPVAYYSAPSLNHVFFCDYDASGNLWVDGFSSASAFDLAELKKGSKKFTHIYVNQTMTYPGYIQWLGKYLAIGDLTVVYRFLVTGDKATTVGGVTLTGAGSVIQYVVQSGKLIGADDGNGDIGIWKFPSGTPVKTITGLKQPLGAVISTVKT